MKRSTPAFLAVTAWFVAGASLAGYALLGAAQGVKAKPGDDDLRAVYATPVEVAEGGRIAEANCARCHGANGVSTTKGVPHLAAQRAAYLDLQLRAYQQSARVQGAMGGIVRFLSDDALLKVAAYYASLEPPRPAVSPAKAAAQKPDPVQAGKAAAAVGLATSLAAAAATLNSRMRRGKISNNRSRSPSKRPTPGRRGSSGCQRSMVSRAASK